MNYSLKRISKVITQYVRRNILPGVNREFVIIDLTNSLLGRITENTKQENIVSILGNDFADYSKKFLFTVKEYLEMPPDFVLTSKQLKRKQFTYFWGIYKSKLLCDTLENLPTDMEVMPVRNWKKSYGRIIKADCCGDSVSLFFIDEYGNKIYYPQTGNNTKTLLVGPKYQLFLACNPCWDMREYSTKLNEYLKDNPSYLVLLDNGRFENYQINNVDKEKYLSTAFCDYKDMFVFGELK